MSGEIATTLGEFAAGLRLADVPAAVRERARGVVLNGLAVAAAGGTSTEFGEQAARALDLGPGRSRILTDGRAVGAGDAAFVNGSLMQARGQEDTHGTFHVGSTVLPAALAVGEALGSSGAELERAIIAGYETGTALSVAFTDLSTPPHRATSVYGPVAAAVATGCLIGLAPEGLTTAVATASSLSGGTTEWAAAGTHEGRFQGGWAAASGITAARLAAAGITASTTSFEGPGGFLAAYAPGGADRAALVGRGLGESWRLLEVTFKPFPACAFNQSPTTAALRALQAGGLAAAGVSRIKIEMPTAEARYQGVDYRGPFETLEQAQMSVQRCVAVALRDGNLSMHAISPHRDPELDRLVAATTVTARDDWVDKRTRIELQSTAGDVYASEIRDPVADFAWGTDALLEHCRRLEPESKLDPDRLWQVIAEMGGERGAAAILDTCLEGRS